MSHQFPMKQLTHQKWPVSTVLPSRVTQSHHIGLQCHVTNAPQRCSGSAPGQPGDAGAVADDVRLQDVVKHGPGVSRVAGGGMLQKNWLGMKPELIALKTDGFWAKIPCGTNRWMNLLQFGWVDVTCHCLCMLLLQNITNPVGHWSCDMKTPCGEELNQSRSAVWCNTLKTSSFLIKPLAMFGQLIEFPPGPDNFHQSCSKIPILVGFNPLTHSSHQPK